jgi:hypothetical protein
MITSTNITQTVSFTGRPLFVQVGDKSNERAIRLLE